MNYTDPALDPDDPLGTDLLLDPTGDLVITPQGDIALASDITNVLQMIRVRLQTIPDSYLFGDDLGSQLGETIDEPLHDITQKLVEQYVYNALIVDERIASINSVKLVGKGDGSDRAMLYLNVDITDVGPVDTTIPLGGV